MTEHRSAAPSDDDAADAEAVQQLTDLALACARGRAPAEHLARAVRRHLARHEEDVLVDALDQARGLADRCFTVLREALEDAAANVLLRRDGAPDIEVSAFAIPVFVRTTGGLRLEHGFQDDAAYDALLASVIDGGLESPQAKVVLIRHWYDLAELRRLGYARMHELAREVGQALGVRKPQPLPALERSMSGWQQAPFGPADAALELRFLLGFARKRADDPFYVVPADPALADLYFEQRMGRFRAWTGTAAPLAQRLLAPAGAAPELNFLYQDLVFGARAEAEAELFVLTLLADIHAACERAGIAPAAAHATASLHQDETLTVLALAVHGPDGSWLAGAERVLDPDADPGGELADLDDALGSLGLPPLVRA